MKKYFSFFIVLCVSATSLFYGCKPCPKTANFPCLVISTATARSWFAPHINHNPFDQFIFNSYNASPDSSWQLICYGQHQTTDSLDYLPLSNPFPIYDSFSTHFDSTKLAFGNLALSADTLRKMVEPAGDTSLLFVPAVATKNFRHLTYYLYLVKYNSATKTITARIKLRGVIFDANNPVVKVDPVTNDEYIELNPCPPAHMDTQ